MSRISATEVRGYIVSYLSKKMESSGRTFDGDPSDDFDLLKEGIIDSLGMLDLITHIERHFGLEVDFEGLNPEEMTIIGPLCRYVENALK
jgi:acyl carrier protein